MGFGVLTTVVMKSSLLGLLLNSEDIAEIIFRNVSNIAVYRTLRPITVAARSKA
jgi:hypothetical protein